MIVKCISIYLFFSIMLLSFMFVNSFIRSKSSYAKVLGALSLILQVYLLGYLIEINSITLKEMLFWNGIQYISIPFYPALWLVVSILYTGRGKYLQGFRGILVFAIPVMTFFIHMTNHWHHLYYSKIELETFRGMKLMLLTKGPWYFVQTIYILIALVLCTWFYFQRYKRSIGDERMQFRLLLIASVVPYLALILVTMNLGGIGIDYTALILPPSILLISLALTRYNFLEIKTLARERVFEDSTTGLVLMNRFFRVLDFNEASIRLFQFFDVQPKEVQMEELLSNHPDILESIKNSQNKVYHIIKGKEHYYIDISIKEFHNEDIVIGCLLTLEDVTERELLKWRLTEMANKDELSGLNNRRKFSESALEYYEYAKNQKEPLCVLMVDIDYFKKINDSFGHSIGDTVIRVFSEMLSEKFQGANLIGRMGGEEFAVVMPHSDVEKAYQYAEDLRSKVEVKNMVPELQIQITVSIGVAELREETSDFDALLKSADQALYEAKRLGRNCVSISSEN